MNKNKLIIFPTNKQLEYICEKKPSYNIYIISHDNINMNQMGVIQLNEQTIKTLGTDVDVLCCHEEGLYWINTFGNKDWNYQFSPKLFELLEKDKFKDYLSAHNILNAKYSKGIENIDKYPIISKPIIGFGSIGVKKINNQTEFNKQLNAYNQIQMLSRIKPYKEKYFSSIENIFIFEEFIAGTFYRTPFIVYDNTIKYVFPIKGITTTFRENSDFHWTDFEYGESERRIASDICITLENLLNVFELKSGVYVAEFIVSKDNNIYLLELSPRQTSERIAKIIELSTGIDLEKIAIDIFFHEATINISCERHIRMKITRSSSIMEDIDYKIIEIQKEQSVYGDNIITVYSERKKEYES